MTDFWGRGSCIRRREAEIALQCIERRSALAPALRAKEFGAKSIPVNEEFSGLDGQR